jgi:hypothetical protein
MRGVAMVRSHWSLDLILGRRMSAFGVLWRAAVLYLGLATALPTSVRSLGHHSKAARDHAAAMQLAQAIQPCRHGSGDAWQVDHPGSRHAHAASDGAVPRPDKLAPSISRARRHPFGLLAAFTRRQPCAASSVPGNGDRRRRLVVRQVPRLEVVYGGTLLSNRS